MAKKYLVVEKAKYWGEEVLLIPLFFSKEEIIKRYVGVFVKIETDKWVKVRDEEEGYELLMQILEYCSIKGFIERNNGEEYELEEWKKEVKNKIFCGVCPSIKVYEILEHGVFEVDNLKFVEYL